jgi:hypothetical protein
MEIDPGRLRGGSGKDALRGAPDLIGTDEAPIAEAQHDIASDRIAAYQKYCRPRATARPVQPGTSMK